MLSHLSIRNYTLVHHLELELSSGMTAITGETGAGKSVVLDALGLALGDRADAGRVRSGQQRADICASFDVRGLPQAQQWLEEHALDLGRDEEGEQECLLRRIVTREGRSRAFINGQTVTLAQLRELGEMLIDIHAQHEHQSLLLKDTQRRLLDEFGNHCELAADVKHAHQQWQHHLHQFQTRRDNQAETSAKLQLLSYQVGELEQLALQPGELEQLESEQHRLANAEAILQRCYQLSALCGGEDHSLLEDLNRACNLAGEIPAEVPALREALQLLTSAKIQVEEAQREIEHHIEDFQLDPERLQFVEERLSAVYDIARKHRIKPQQLLELQQQLQIELQSLQGDDNDLEQLESRLQQQEARYMQLARQLSERRGQTVVTLAKQVNQQLKRLAMEHAKLQIALTNKSTGDGNGLEDVEILIRTNPGQPLRPLSKIASGGELSRISLAIQVVTAQTSVTPTLVFDEVDVGIGGATADVVGQLLQKLGERAQVLCVTHLAQVAGRAHQHLRVNKAAKGSRIDVSIEPLDDQQKVEEIARMIGTNTVTQTTLNHAREILQNKEVA